jgi:environmental stress-induced protein Ves
MTATLIPFAGLAVSPWRNGAGRKADIAAATDWLVGFAWLDADVPFSEYGGHDRTIMLIDGPGFTLDFGQSRPALVARRPFVPSAFDGGWAARCRVPDGRCTVLNAMTARATWSHSVTVSPAPVLAPPASGGVALLVVLEGSVAIGGQMAGPRDTFRIANTTTIHAGADARAALIRIDPIQPEV